MPISLCEEGWKPQLTVVIHIVAQMEEDALY